jgi:kynurenine 3-monooxygenase
MRTSTEQKPKKIVVVGAGPSGLLTCIFLLRRNLVENPSTKYQVTLVDPGLDYGKLDESGLKKFRSWMIGLTSHGLHAVKKVPGLYEDYIENLGVSLTNTTISFGSKIKFDFELSEEQIASTGFLVDRNFICSALARYLSEKFSESQTTGTTDFVAHYNTRALFLDNEKQRVMVRSVNSDSSLPEDTMIPLEYDYILGCDGVRSVVRNGFLTHHREFEFDLTDSFQEGKAVHIPLPKGINEGHFMILLQCLPNMTAFCLPEKGGLFNFALGYSLEKPCDPDMTSDDPKVVTAYMKKHFTALQLDLEDFGEKWVKQSVATTQFVHCNFYHSLKLNALIMGDAAHATVPNIGQGMNTALADALVLDQLLDKFGDDWKQVLPAFSEERVKEGNALTDLSYHTYSIDPGMQLEIVLRQIFRRFFNKIFPEWLVEKEPMNAIAIERMKLSEAYNKTTKYGYLVKSRRVNQDIKRKYFERKMGMVKEEPKSSFVSVYWLLVIFVAIASYYVGRGIVLTRPSAAMQVDTPDASSTTKFPFLSTWF